MIYVYIDEEDILHYRISQLSVSPENTVLHYLHLDVGEGVYLAPTTGAPPGPAHAQILDNFRAACQIIHRLDTRLSKSVKNPTCCANFFNAVKLPESARTSPKIILFE